MTRRVLAWVAGLSGRDRRALRLGLLVLLPILLLQVGVRPYLGALRDLNARAERERGLLQRELSLLAERQDLTIRYAAAERALISQAPRLFTGSDPVAASAGLANYVTGMAAKHRVFVQESETRAAEAAGEGVARLVVEARAIGDLEGILAWLSALESGPKLVTVERLAMARAERLNRDATTEEEVLGLTATLAGYALDEAETGP